jgi:hypothetical protein
VGVALTTGKDRIAARVVTDASAILGFPDVFLDDSIATGFFCLGFF